MANSTAVVATSTKSGALSSALGIGSLKRSQLEVLQTLVAKHLVDPSLVEIASGDDFTVTSLERGIPRYEHPHLVAALDVFLMYQRNRRAQGIYSAVSMRGTFKHDPRTRLIELYKRWLRNNAANANVSEEDARRMCALCRDVLNHPRLFPSRNKVSFMHTLAEVYDHLKLQLREVLEHDRTCAELAARALCLSRNLVSDAITFLLLAATDLKQTDKLPSVEVVYLWQSLPAEINPLPARADKSMQKLMKDAWATQCGSLITLLLSVRWAFRLFDGAGAEDEAAATAAATATNNAKPENSDTDAVVVAPHPAETVPARIAEVTAEFEKGNFKASGLAGAFRESGQGAPAAAWRSYLKAVEAVFDLVYLLGDVLVLFHRISDGLGDYGMIRVAPWLHPFLDGLVEKVQRLRESLEKLNETVDNELILAKARGQKVKQPAPTQGMSSRAHAAINRAITGTDCHVSFLLQIFEELRSRSAPERLPHVMEGLGDACSQLQKALGSPQFLARVGDSCKDLPPLSSMSTVSTVQDDSSPLAIEIDGDLSDDDASGSPTSPSGASENVTLTGLHVRRRAASVGRSAKEAFKRMTGKQTGDMADAEAEEADSPTEGQQEKEAAAEAEGQPQESPDTAVTSAAVEGPGTTAVIAPPPPEPAAAAAVVAVANPQEPVGELKAEVYRLTMDARGCKRHDQRYLLLSGGVLQIYEKGSKAQVKTAVKVAQEMEENSILSSGIMTMKIRRARRSRTLWGTSNAAPAELSGSEETESKMYLFEFVEAELADSFQAELTRLRRYSY